MKLLRMLFVILLLLTSHHLFSQGKVYLVLGSDTAIWESMDVSRYHCTYALSLYTDPARNAARVMDPAFRLPLTDSFGTPVKLTWWMMAGNIFRHATNTNIPNPNTMTLHLMKKYHKEWIKAWGDELTLHYHTFVWTDYDGDGTFYWNQALTFPESSDDFDVTLAEMLLEEETFPVSFRSGWHAMDNAWQRRLNELLPYSLHNDWPAKRTDLTEPLDNTYDWSRSPSVFVPFKPSRTDYQVPGLGAGWNVRSEYMASCDSAFMRKIFAAAAAGTDQVACLWAHLPETDFLDNVRKVNTSAHKVAPLFPGVEFRYCTAVEAMQLWRKTEDTTKPHVTITEINEGATVRWAVTSNEPIFQTVPFVAAKDRYGEYHVLPCRGTGYHAWETTAALDRSALAKAGVAMTDTAGNLSISIIRYLPDDIILDDLDAGYTDLSGSWSSTSTTSWGTSSRLAVLGNTDSAKAVWRPTVAEAGFYNIFVQVPKISNTAPEVEYRIMEGGVTLAAKKFTSGLPANQWVYIGTQNLKAGTRNSVVVAASGASQSGKAVQADVVKFSAMVRDQWLVVPDAFDVGEVVVGEETPRYLTVRNEGIQPVFITGVTSVHGTVQAKGAIPMAIPAMGETQVELAVRSDNIGPLTDTLQLASDDPRHAVLTRTVVGNTVNYFELVDDRDSISYRETGAWNFSVAQAYGATSRYANPAAGVSAAFLATIERDGVYEIREIVPATVNASVRARYMLNVDGQRVDSVFIDQNTGSGNWVTLMERTFSAGNVVRLELTDAMSPVVAGKVLRADAVRFQWVRDDPTAVDPAERGIPSAFSLNQNFPNPFNPTTVVSFQLPVASDVKLAVYDLLGREIAVLVNDQKAPGYYKVRFEEVGLASGVYICRLTAGNVVQTRKMALVR